MTDERRNAFGRLACSPDSLPLEQRVDEMSRLAGGLISGNPDPMAAQWLGHRLMDWLQRGGRLEKHLGVIAPVGSHSTAANLLRRRQRNALLLRFANEIGSDRAALRILRGLDNCPTVAASSLAELQNFGRAPTAHDAISRARRASAHHG